MKVSPAKRIDVHGQEHARFRCKYIYFEEKKYFKELYLTVSQFPGGNVNLQTATEKKNTE